METSNEPYWGVAQILERLTNGGLGRSPLNERSALRDIEHKIKSKEILTLGRDAWWWKGKIVVEGRLEPVHRHDRIGDLELRRAPDGQVVLAPLDKDPFALEAPSPDDVQPPGYIAGYRELDDYRHGKVKIPANSERGMADLRLRRDDVMAVWPDDAQPATTKKKAPPAMPGGEEDDPEKPIPFLKFYKAPPPLEEGGESRQQKKVRRQRIAMEILKNYGNARQKDVATMIASQDGVTLGAIIKALTPWEELKERAVIERYRR
jgi:hypothetical protein